MDPIKGFHSYELTIKHLEPLVAGLEDLLEPPTSLFPLLWIELIYYSFDCEVMVGGLWWYSCMYAYCLEYDYLSYVFLLDLERELVENKLKIKNYKVPKKFGVRYTCKKFDFRKV